jgi:hypothetical protein
MTASDGRSSTNNQLISALHRAHGEVTSQQRHLLEIIAQCDEHELWREDGARDTAAWLTAHLGISNWAARRWIHAAHALAHLPDTRAAFEATTRWAPVEGLRPSGRWRSNSRPAHGPCG